ncbi:MAG: hypothetical protein NT038_06170 [Euryarchaeota archaeon]|nr:hypothetical protein [Euryarchaeota archaeon]
MVETYRAICRSCSASFTVQYGSKTNTITYEIYSCPQCRNLFSLTNQEPFTCPTCKNQQLIRYNFHKEENMLYYKKMLKQNLLSKQNYDLLEAYWKNTKNNTCPVCNNETLDWHILNDAITCEPQIYL